MNLLQQLPDPVQDLIKSSNHASFTTISAAGAPIDTPLLVFYPEDLATLDFATGVAYPAKAERARRNPRIGIMIEGGKNEPIVSIAGMAAVRDTDIQANAIRYISEVGNYGPTLQHPWEIGHKAVWYWSRIIIEVMPVRVMWWDNRAAMDGPPLLLEQPAGTAYPSSNPAPAAKASAAIDWPAVPWREHIQSYLDRGAIGQLSLFDSDGFALPFSARGARLEGDTLVAEMPKGLPWTQESGIAGFTFEGSATFVGEVSRSGSTCRFSIQRMLPFMPMVVDSRQVLLPEGKAGLLERLRSELGRRGQSIPVIPPVKPGPTPGSDRREARMEAIMNRAAARAS